MFMGGGLSVGWRGHVDGIEESGKVLPTIVHIQAT